MSSNVMGAGVVPINQVSEKEIAEMEHQRGMLIPINAEYVFNLYTWYNSPERTANRYPEMDKKKSATFLADIESAGVLRMPVLDENTLQVVDGRTRLTHLFLARSKQIECSFPGFELRFFKDDSEIHDYQDRVGMQTRQLSRAQKQVLIKEAIIRHPDWADSRIGSIVQADSETVARVSEKLIEDGLVIRPDQRLGLDGRFTNAVRKEKKAKPTRSADKSPLTVFLDAWLDRFSYYPVTASDLISIMAAMRYQLDGGSAVTPENHKTMVRTVGVYLHKLAKSNPVNKSCGLYVRNVREGQPVFGLIPVSMRKPKLENGAVKAEASELQARAAHLNEEACVSESQISC